MKNTNRKGVDIIFTTKAREIFDGSLFYILRNLSDGGNFIEMGGAEILKMQPTECNKSYSFHSVMPDKLLKLPRKHKREINKLLNEGR